MQRSSLLRELLAPLPKDILHAGKKASDITQDGVSLRITFEDGSSEVFDAVIGADGIFSKVREHVHGDGAERHAASPAGFWDSRNMVPFDNASKIIGEEYFKVDRQYGWVGQGGFIMHDVAENRSIVQCVMCMVEKETPENRKRPLTRAFLEEAFSAWLDGPIAKNMIDVGDVIVSGTRSC